MTNNNNYLIIMAGGIGSRFWPFSRQAKPKQFLDFFGTGKTLLQMTIDRYRDLVPVENILIVTNEIYKDIILQQIPSMSQEQVLLEPCRRNTAPCIAYAVARIKKQQTAANIIVAASDHLITDEKTFTNTIAVGLEYIASHDHILTLGMKPTRAETGYGYIKIQNIDAAAAEKTSSNTHIYDVQEFKEKPDLLTAQRYLAEGNYLWNSGMFMFNLQTIVHAFKTYLHEVWNIFDAAQQTLLTPAEQEYIKEHFPLCPNISIDYGIMEKSPDVKVLPSDFGWSDLGNWASLHDLSQKDTNNNVTIHSDAEFYNATDNIVTLESGKLAIIKDLSHYIIAEADGVLLICPRAEEQYIKQIVSDIQSSHPDKL